MEYIDAKTIVTRNRANSWFGYEYNMNIYRGCNHGCIYCDSRSDCYGVYEFDTVKAKNNALQIIRDDLQRKVKKGVICSGAMSDPYNCFEEELKLSRNSLELINAYQFGIGIVTKSTLVARDIDILQDIKSHSPVLINMTITTADEKLSRIIEPGAPLPEHRFEVLKKMDQAGIFAGIILMPVLPFITDQTENIIKIVKRAADSGAKYIYPRFGVTLRGNQKEWYYNQLEQHFPGFKEKYIKTYGQRIRCNSKREAVLMKVFIEHCDKYGILHGMDTIKRKSRMGYSFESRY